MNVLLWNMWVWPGQPMSESTLLARVWVFLDWWSVSQRPSTIAEIFFRIRVSQWFDTGFRNFFDYECATAPWVISRRRTKRPITATFEELMSYYGARKDFDVQLHFESLRILHSRLDPSTFQNVVLDEQFQTTNWSSLFQRGTVSG